MPDRVAALYVETGGCYFGLEDVDPWDINRDARLRTPIGFRDLLLSLARSAWAFGGFDAPQG